ncbi:MAG: sigma-54-dependent Fis family transcriptional regulator [Acidobacteria bacterium]|nr:sigma-54-dependent Fis family transcriptional regulator [Acidobacteriota bacterium]
MQQTLSLERKLQMYEAREAILRRIGSETFSVIDLNHFLRATVSEIGRMMGAERCDVMTIEPDGVLRITHEYRAENLELPSSLGIEIDLDRLPENFDFYTAKAFADATAPELPHTIRALAEKLSTKSLLIVPITFNLKLLGAIALHHCHQSYYWKADEIAFVQSLTEQIAIGYRYTQIYSEKEKEARINQALLEIANDINTGSDFSPVTERILDKAIDLLGLEAACLAILDSNEIHFTNLRTAATSSAEILKRPSLQFPILDLLPKKIEHGQMLKILSPDQHAYARSFLNEVFTAGACIISPMVVEDRLFGALILLWAEPKNHFMLDDTALALGIADQLAIALSKARLSAEVLRLRQELEHAQSSHNRSGLVGKSDTIMRCMEMALYVADSYTTVLIQGESGTGKEVLADLIQVNSSRAAKPYVKINCGAIPETLLESELFGHEKGAFTDARSRRIGKFEEANNGTLFLDEIGEMTLAAQVRLLRVLQNGEIARVGGNEIIKTDVRVIAATNMDLEEAVREGRFRRDLFYRLNVYPIKLPALRERREDIPLLAIHFLEIYKNRSNKNITGISEKALSRLRRYDWPGNVRELENAIERSVIIAQGNMITLDDLPDAARGAENEVDARQTVEIEVGTPIDEVEKRLILETLSYNNGDRTRTAQMLGIGRKTLYRKLQQYGNP